MTATIDMRGTLFRFVACLALAATASAAAAQAYPSKPIRLIVPLAAGSTRGRGWKTRCPAIT